MSDPAVVDTCTATAAVRSAPPQVRLPSLVQGLAMTAFRRAAMRSWLEHNGGIVGFRVPFFGRCVAVSDPALVRLVCTADPEQLVNYQPNVSAFFGPGSIFALAGRRHHERRRALAPSFHGRCLKDHEAIIVGEVLLETSTWPERREFRTFESINRITLNVILRSIFGADGDELEELRELVPRYSTFASTMVKFMPVRVLRRGPWNRLDKLRGRIDGIVLALIDKAGADPELDGRTDVLASLLRHRGRISRQAICDEVVGLIGAGHETTTAALSWTFERLRRHPDVVAELMREVDEGGSAFRRATILEVLRTRPVIDLPGRWVSAPHFDLGPWRIPHGHNVFVSLPDLHTDADIFADPERFDPNRFRDTAPPPWLAFGTGARRCLGAEFAVNEIDIVLRTVLQRFRIHTDSAPDEKSHFRGVAHVPRRGGRIVLTRRR
jgi:cytochrome P450